MEDKSLQHFGYAAIVGEPNAGKSTLVNALLKQKITIVTPKVQTTRFRVQGIYVEGNAQMVLVDTPGLFAPKTRLDKAMVKSARDGFDAADIAIFLIDLKSKQSAQQIFDVLSKNRAPDKKLYVLNKCDIVKKDVIETVRQSVIAQDPNAEIHVISALRGEGVDELRTRVMQLLPQAPWHYPEDQLTDISERLLAAEITREQIFLQLSQELPYGIHVDTEKWEDYKNGSVKIDQAVILAREAHKPIVLGKGGTQIKKIREAAQAEMQKAFDRPVHLFLFVKVREDWAENKAFYKDMGLEF